MNEACGCKERWRDVLSQEARRLRNDTRCAFYDAEDMQEEVVRIQNMLVMEGAKTVFRLRAEVQNMQ